MAADFYLIHISMETPKQIEHLFPPKNPSLAKTVTEMGLVSLNTSLRVFVVKNPSDETVHVARNTTNGALCSVPALESTTTYLQ